MAINILQFGSGSFTISGSGPSFVSGSGTITPGSAITAGSSILIIMAALANGGGNVINWAASDSLSNSYGSAAHGDAGTQTPGMALIWAKNVAGGSDVLTAQAQANFPAFGSTVTVEWGFLEIGGFGASAVQQGVQLQQNNASGGTMNLAITDSRGISITSGFGSPNQQVGSVIDIAGLGADLFTAAAFPFSAGFVPTVSPSSFSYNQEFSQGNLLVFVRSGLPLSTGVRPQIFVVT